MENVRLQTLLLILGIIATILNIIKVILDLVEKIGAKEKAQILPKPRKRRRK